MLTGKDLEHAISHLPGEKVTKDYINSRVKRVEFKRGEWQLDTLTICIIVLDNGYQVVGKSACVDPANFDVEIGQSLAYEDAYRHLWPLFGFLLAEKRLVQSKIEDPKDERESNP